MGGTNILAPLNWILRQPMQRGHPRLLFLLTDGTVSNTGKVIELLRSHARFTRSGFAHSYPCSCKILFSKASYIASKVYIWSVHAFLETWHWRCLCHDLLLLYNVLLHCNLRSLLVSFKYDCTVLLKCCANVLIWIFGGFFGYLESFHELFYFILFYFIFY